MKKDDRESSKVDVVYGEYSYKDPYGHEAWKMGEPQEYVSWEEYLEWKEEHKRKS